jgi:multidrug efflux pump subunit AcrA (membrane-fusion protein)
VGRSRPERAINRVVLPAPEGQRNISIGRKNPKFYEVLEGLQPGEKVIVSGYETFGKNEKLILKKTN